MSSGQIEAAFAQASLPDLSPVAYEQFRTYLDLLMRWNARLNLTAIREAEQIIQRHFVECAFAAQHLPDGVGSLMDYGSGAGLPGIPIAICRPEVRVTLAESQGKKAAFLREAARSLDISLEIFDQRVEGMPPERAFDAVTMRAVEKMELALPVAVRHARRYLILFTTERAAPSYVDLPTEFGWREPIALPNAEQMILVIGERAVFNASPIVPRGTA